MRAHVRRAWVKHGLEVVGFVKPGPQLPDGSEDPGASEARQAVRHLLHQVVGSTTGLRALDEIEAAVGRRAVVLMLTGEELAKLKQHLERARAAG